MRVSNTAIVAFFTIFTGLAKSSEPFEISSRVMEILPNRVIISWPFDEEYLYKLLYAPIPYTGPERGRDSGTSER